MKNRTTKSATGYMGQFLTVLRRTRIPWLWVVISFLINLGANTMLLKLPVLTAGLLAGDLSDKALWDNILYYVVFAVVVCSQSTVLAIARSMTTRNARGCLWKKMLHIRVDYYDRNDPGTLMSAVTNDLYVAMPAIMSLLVTVIPDLWYVIQALRQISGYHPILLLSVVVFLPIKYIYTVIIGRKFYQARLGIFRQIGGLTGYLAERIANLSLIKTFTREDQELANGRAAAQGLFKAKMREYKLSAANEAIRTLITLGEQIVVMVVAVILLQQKKITITQWAAFFLFFQNITIVFDTLINDWMQVKDIQGAVARTAELLTVPEEVVKEPREGLPRTLAGDIEFDHVSFAYGDKQALNDVSFTVPQGSMTAIVGLCGSGKTTSLSLLERFYAPAEGQIRLGGKPVNEMPLGEYRRYFAYVQQNPEVFSGTVREALTYGIQREVSDGEIWQAAGMAGFTDYLELQSQGLDAQVSSGGGSMSGGQRQRLVLTREFLRGAQILLLDEPTSALDAESSAMVQRAIFTLFKGKTVLMVTHDMDLLRGMDQIIVLQESRLVGCGTYDRLMESCDLFREMIETRENEREVTV